MCIDCEGTLSLARHNKDREGKAISIQSDICAVNTDVRLMKWLIPNFGGRYYTRQSRDAENHKISFVWRVTGKKNKENIILGILPYLIMKREQAKLLLEFLRIPGQNPARRLELMEACQKLNAKGPAQTTNTLDNPDNGLKIESELIGDYESAPDVNQGEDRILGTELCTA